MLSLYIPFLKRGKIFYCKMDLKGGVHKALVQPLTKVFIFADALQMYLYGPIY